MEGGYDEHKKERQFIKNTRVGSEVIVSQIKKQHAEINENPSNQEWEIDGVFSPKEYQRTEYNEPA
jgi:hypothetical protein